MHHAKGIPVWKIKNTNTGVILKKNLDRKEVEHQFEFVTLSPRNLPLEFLYIYTYNVFSQQEAKRIQQFLCFLKICCQILYNTININKTTTISERKGRLGGMLRISLVLNKIGFFFFLLSVCGHVHKTSPPVSTMSPRFFPPTSSQNCCYYFVCVCVRVYVSIFFFIFRFLYFFYPRAVYPFFSQITNNKILIIKNKVKNNNANWFLVVFPHSH